jgi:hypothetical protein
VLAMGWIKQCAPVSMVRPDTGVRNLKVVRNNDVGVLNQKPKVGDFEISKRDQFRPGLAPFDPTGDIEAETNVGSRQNI